MWALASSVPILKPLVAHRGLASLRTQQALRMNSKPGEAVSESHDSALEDPCRHRIDLSSPEVWSETEPPPRPPEYRLDQNGPKVLSETDPCNHRLDLSGPEVLDETDSYSHRLDLGSPGVPSEDSCANPDCQEPGHGPEAAMKFL